MIRLNSPIKVAGNPVIKLLDKVFKKPENFQFKKVNDILYRGSEATLKEIPILAQNGIKVILNLKTVNTKEIEKLAAEAKQYGINYINIPLNPFRVKKSFPHIIDAINNASKENPLFIHCTFGKDRTGFATALGRYLKEKMPMTEAIKDMRNNGFREFPFFNMERFLKKFDKQSQKLVSK